MAVDADDVEEGAEEKQVDPADGPASVPPAAPAGEGEAAATGAGQQARLATPVPLSWLGESPTWGSNAWVVHGSRTETVPDSYRRYLVNRIVKHFKLRGTPVFLEFRNSENPYKDRKNTLTRRQLEKRKRLKKFTGRKSRK